MCKVHILCELVDGPYGGSHQFLKALRDGLRSKGVYSETVESANLIIFNSCQHIDDVLQAKKGFPEKVFMHRIDGPIQLYNMSSDLRDLIVYTVNRIIADATVFQSEWSRAENFRLGLKPTSHETLISNAPNSDVFNSKNRIEFSQFRKIRLIASSWSSNWKKGFEVYQWLDQHLDFARYEMTFVGNSPITFENIKMIKPLKSDELACELKQHDIYITALQKEACSNSLIEALSCGLPALVLRDGGNPVIVGAGGATFSCADEIPALLDQIVRNYKAIQSMIRVPEISEVVDLYYGFCKELVFAINNEGLSPKKLSLFSFLQMHCILKGLRLKELFNSKIERFYGHR
ncbi:glycosyltransferase [Pelobacter propionicus]|nr:glycosyltransferase [Pelobacter propionicus]